MHHIELRVHIGAPSMVSDDRRWKNVAQGVANFKPVRRVNVSGGTFGSIHEEVSSAGGDQLPTPTQPISASPSITDLSDDRLPVVKRSSLAGQDNECSRDITTKRKRAAEQYPHTDVSEAKRTKRTLYSRTKKGLNPAFKNPIPAVLKTKKAVDRTLRSPTIPDVTILVPVTTGPKAQRPRLDSKGNEAVNADLLPNASTSSDLVAETSFFAAYPVGNESQIASPFPISNASLSRDSFNAQGFLANQEELQSSDHHDKHSIRTDDTTFRLSQTSIHESDIVFGTTRANSRITNLSEQDEKHGDILAQLSGSASSTKSPSSRAQSFMDLSPLARRSACTAASVVDLTVENEPTTPKVQCRDVLGPVSSPTEVVDQRHDDDTLMTSHEVRIDTIQRLPRRIECQASNTNANRQFKSFIPDFMQEIAKQYSLVELFRPLRAPQSLKNSERGYWKMLIRVTDLATAAKAKRISPTTSQWSEQRFMLRQRARVEETATTPERDAVLRTLIYPPKSADSYSLWAAEQFIQFWSYLGKTIERGRAGYDARATMDVRPEDGRELLVDVRFWCYAENLSHIWLILLGLSGELTNQMPLQWCVPGKGPLISMSGQSRNRGSIGRWVERRSGVDGYWGLEDTS